MNQAQKNKISKARGMMEEAQGILQEVHSELENKYESSSEKFQESEKGETLQTQISSLEEIKDNLDGDVSTLSDMENEE